MKQMDQDTMEGVLRLRHHPDWERFVGYLGDAQETEDNRLRSGGRGFSRDELAGRAQVLVELQKQIADVESDLKRMQREAAAGGGA